MVISLEKEMNTEYWFKLEGEGVQTAEVILTLIQKSLMCVL